VIERRGTKGKKATEIVKEKREREREREKEREREREGQRE